VSKIVINNKEFTPEEVATLAKAGALQIGAKHDTSSATPTATPPHGPFPGNNAQFGVLSSAGVRPGFWNATPRVRSISQYIPMYKSTILQELIDVATGVTAGSGNNVTGACAVGPKPGQLKAMKIAASFGIIHISTKIFDVTQAGMRRNRAEIDREVFNQAQVTNPWLPQVPGVDGSGAIATAMRAEMYALGVELERNVSQVHFKGVSGTSDNAYRGVATQWNGLDRLIRNDWTDHDTGLAVEVASANVQSFNAALVGGTDSAGRGFVNALIDAYYAQKDFLDGLGIAPVFALVMRADMFRAIASVWSCTYGTDRCTGSAGNPVQRSQEAIQRNYEEIMATMLLPMDGDNIPVIIDDAIARDTLGNNYFKSDIYGVCLTGNGRPTLYGEFFDMDNAEALEIVNFMGENSSTTVNNGMYRVFKRVTGGCVEFDFYARPRLITDAPFTHFRLDDVFYRADYKQRDAIPGFSYYVNGGTTYRT
jgi:hypothetical protein